METQLKKRRLNAGFTLIELLVVLVILGLLAGMVGPNVMKYIGSSKVEVAKAQLDRDDRRSLSSNAPRSFRTHRASSAF